METEAERAARQNAEREEALRRVPFQKIDKSKWPDNVRAISIGEADGLGIDPDGRLHWNGKPVEIVGRRIDLSRTQAVVALIVAVFTILGAIGAVAQGWTAYHDWACRNNRQSILSCPVPVQEPAKSLAPESD